MTAAAADRGGAVGHGAGLLYRSGLLSSNTAAVPQDTHGGSCGRCDLRSCGRCAAPFIGSLADWVSTLSPLLGREETTALIQAQYDRLMPTMYTAYGGMVLLILASAFAVLTGKTVLPRGMFALHMIVFQLVFVLIPDVRQALGAEILTWDFVLSQGSGNAALCLWMTANAVWAGRQKT